MRTKNRYPEKHTPLPKNRHLPKIWEYHSQGSTPMVRPLPIGKPKNHFFSASFSSTGKRMLNLVSRHTLQFLKET